MKIDKNLNLVIPIDTADGGTIYAHSTPISRDVFEAFHLEIAKTFTSIYGEGLHVVGGPRIAALRLKAIAQSMGRWEGPNGVERSLMPEIRRMTNVFAPGDKGWEMIPLEDAARTGVIDEDDSAELEGVITFFILASAMHRKAELRAILEVFSHIYDAQISSSSCTEFARSLPTSTPGASSGPKVELSVPS